jgi:hypothetical protein
LLGGDWIPIPFELMVISTVLEQEKEVIEFKGEDRRDEERVHCD